MREETAALQKLVADVRLALARTSATNAVTALRALNATSSGCLKIIEADRSSVPAIIVWDQRTYGPGAIAYHDGAEWRASAFALPDGSVGKESFLWRELRVTREGADFLLIGTTHAFEVCRSGCGGIGPGQFRGWIVTYRLQDPPVLLWRSPTDSGVESLMLSDDLILVGSVLEDDLYADPHGCCAQWRPVGQVLWERRGASFHARAERVYSSPYRAAGAFIGASSAGDRAAAIRFAADPGVYESFRVLSAGRTIAPPGGCSGCVIGEPIALTIEDEEKLVWDALPPGVRSGVTATTVRFEYRYNDIVFDIVLSRIEGEWKVTEIRRV